MQAVTAAQNQRLGIASHVRACYSNGQVILLDLRRNRYIGVGSPHLGALSDHVDGWPRSPETTNDGNNSAAVNVLTHRLVSQGLLTDRPTDRRPDITVEEATSSLDFEDATTDRAVSARCLGRFLRSAAVTAAWLRFRSLHSIANAVAARRERLEPTTSDSASGRAMLGAAAAYDKLRPFVFTAQDKCLHDSLALIGFMASEGIFPRWVIGVKTRPFAAHSWVQSGATVLNDHHEHVRRFRPILVV